MKRSIILLFTFACGQPFSSGIFGDSSNAGGSGGEDSEADGGSGGKLVGSNSSTGPTLVGVSGSTGSNSGGAAASGSSVAASSGVSSGVGGASPCAGCIDAEGTCQEGDQNTACGSNGQACNPCMNECGWDIPGPDSWCASGFGVEHFACVNHACAPVEDAWGLTGECCQLGANGCSEGKCEL